jgi:hypothetical protein
MEHAEDLIIIKKYIYIHDIVNWLKRVAVMEKKMNFVMLSFWERNL